MKVTFHVDISATVTIDLPAKQAHKLNAFADTKPDDHFTSDEWPEGAGRFPWVAIEQQFLEEDIEVSQVAIVKTKPKKKAKARR